MQRRHLLALSTAVTLAPRLALAQVQRPTPPPARFIVPYGPGNITDQVARVFAEAMQPLWGGRMVIDNQPGATGMLGVQNLLRSPPDGSTMGIVAVGALAIAPQLTKNVRYDPTIDMVPISGVSVSSAYVAVNKDVPVRSLQELVTYCRAQGPNNPVFFCSPGNASVPRLNLEAMCRQLDFPMTHVAYRTSAAGNTDVLAGRVQVTMDSLSITLPHMLQGTLRPLAYNGDERYSALPNIPTFKEIAPQVSLLNSWQGLFFPKGTPQAIVQRATEETMSVLGSQAFKDRLPIGVSPFAMNPAQLTAQIVEDNRRLGVLVQQIGLTEEDAN